MNQVSDSTKAFFEKFNQANNAFEPDIYATMVSDPFVGAYPNGDVLALKKADYLAQIPEQRPYLQSLGFQFVRTIPLEEVPLGNHYMMVKTHGVMRLEKVPGQPIDLVHDTVYILFTKNDSPKIVFTVTHEDPMKMAQDQGLLPANP